MIEKNNIYNLDCLVGMKEIESESIDLILTDPPYEILNMRDFFLEFLRILKPSGSLYIFGNKNVIAEHWFSQIQMPYKELLIWHYKNSPKPKGRWRMSMQAIIYGYKDKLSTWNEDAARTEYKPATKKLQGRLRPSMGRYDKEAKPYDVSKGALARDVIECPALTGHLSTERVGHDDQKPIALIDRIIKTSSNEGDLVLDAFAGSGTTLISAKNNNRNYIGFEINTEWYNHIKNEMK